MTVRLLIDQNISRRAMRETARIFPGSMHVSSVGLERATDLAIWSFARRRGFTLVSKDGDFHQLALLRGGPPKVIWLNIGNCSTDAIVKLMISSADRIAAFVADPESSLLVLVKPVISP